jgi:DNA-3-methyladenine glycosylase
MQKLPSQYYQESAVHLAKDLIGKRLVRKIDDIHIHCRIVETEAYMGAIDKASHAYGGKCTKRTKNLYQPGGHVYVYSIYGIYYCLNITVNSSELAESVFIRAVEPLDHLDILQQNRSIKGKKTQDLTNGPSKLCQALKIDKSMNGLDLGESDDLFLIDDGFKSAGIVATPRINIDYAQEDKDNLWRFYLEDNAFISK